MIKLSRGLLPGNNYPQLHSEIFTNILIDANVGTIVIGIFTSSFVRNEIRTPALEPGDNGTLRICNLGHHQMKQDNFLRKRELMYL